MRNARGSGQIVAILSAGPVFLVGLAIGGWALAPGAAIDPAALLMGLALAPMAALSVPIGSVLAAVPILLGTAAMRWTGGWNVAMRLPPLWMLVGGGVAGAGAVMIESSTPIVISFAFTGAVCALIARRSVTWVDTPIRARYGG